MVLRCVKFGAAVAFLVVSGLVSVQAADPQAKTNTPVTALPAWGGWYSGVQIGGVGFSGAYDVSSRGPETTSAMDANGGLLLGYMAPLSQNWLMGAEADAGRSLAKSSYTSSGPGQLDTSMTWNGHIRGRMGYGVDKNLFFVAGGAAISIFEQSAPGYANGMNVSKAVYGFSVGAGLDRALTSNMIARVEYLYDQYAPQVYQYNGNNSIKSQYAVNTVRAALIWKF